MGEIEKDKAKEETRMKEIIRRISTGEFHWVGITRNLLTVANGRFAQCKIFGFGHGAADALALLRHYVGSS